MFGLSRYERNKQFLEQYGIAYSRKQDEAYVQHLEAKNLKACSIVKTMREENSELEEIVWNDVGPYTLKACTKEAQQRVQAYVDVLNEVTGAKLQAYDEIDSSHSFEEPDKARVYVGPKEPTLA